MLKKLMVPLDGSENAERVLPWVKQYAARENSEVILLRLAPPEGLGGFSDELERAGNYLQRIERELNYAGVPCKTLVRRGNPARVIVHAAEREGCDLILMSTRGGSKVQRWAVGGVTEQVLRLSPIPVLVVQSRAALPRQGRVRRVIVPVDGSKLAEAALSWSIRLAKLLKAKLVFLYVYPTGPLGLRTRHQPTFEALDRRMTRLCNELQKEGQRAIFRVQSGDAADRILAFADLHDLIVTTTHGAGGFKRWIFGSVAEKLIHEATTPVLVFKRSGQV